MSRRQQEMLRKAMGSALSVWLAQGCLQHYLIVVEEHVDHEFGGAVGQP